MGKKLKVLVVDDTVFYRQLLSKLIEEMPDIVLMGVASNGKIALKKIELSPPDLVLMDMAMPEMDGLEALEKIKAEHPDVDVIMVSGVDREDAALTVKALERGALDFISKPKFASTDASVESLRAELTPLIALARTIKYSREARMVSLDKPSASHIDQPITTDSDTSALRPPSREPLTNQEKEESIPAKRSVPEKRSIPEKRSVPAKRSSVPAQLHSSVSIESKLYRPPCPAPISVAVKRQRAMGRIEVVAIGISTGGPNTLKKIIPRICKELPVPILAVQHMPPMFTASLAESLNRISSITVVEGRAEQTLERGIMYIAPGGRHMVVRKGADSVIKLGMVDTEPVHNCRPAVDVLFRSIAMVFGGNVLTVILTGMGHDGVSGVAAIRRKGGYSLVQDEKSSVVWGMPGAVVEAGEADEIHAEEQIADRIVELVKKSRL